MNTVLIIFLVIVIIIAIVLAIRFYNPDYLIRKSTPLNTPNGTQSTILVTSIDNPGSIRYFYEGWFYINANQPIQTENVLFNRGNNFVVSLNGSTLNLYVNNNATDSNVKSTGVLDLNGSTPITHLASINNFPFQKWTQLVINVDGQTVDIYIDGKFVQNVQSSSPIVTNIVDPISYGNQYTLGSFTKFRRPATNINPQGVWNSFMMGSGQNNSISNDHLNLQVTKNKSVLMNTRLF
jgi:hypothetical protein